MKKLMLSTAIFAALSTASVAQDATSPFRMEADPMLIEASDFIGMRVYASEAALDANEYAGVQDGWEDIGEINDVILSREGSGDSVLVDIGGFLGMGERQVAVNMSSIKFVSDGSTADAAEDFFLVLNANRATLEGAPAYMMDADAAATDAAAPAADAAAADTTVAADANATAPAADATVAADADATVAATDTPMAERTAIVREGYGAMDMKDLTAEKLTGTKVYDANDVWIGEVSQLILTTEGQVQDAIVDVGGFLGMGEKPVALGLDKIDILRQTNGDDVKVYVSMTKEELEALPTYDK